MNSKFDLTGKVAIITGGNGGLGLGIAKGLASVGAKVAVVGRNQDKINNAVEQLQAEGADARDSVRRLPGKTMSTAW
ncbi:MAG: SDR family NAD(P)-dependent oxidoreductase [Gammaproteobacteria bacterium]|nr:SDR family NAD(P)-dependent oxidoreductase [Gammaproteobacteria bacterium]